MVGQRAMALLTSGQQVARVACFDKKPLQLAHRNPPWDGEKNKRMGMLEKKDTIHRPSAVCPVSRQLPSHLHHRSYVHSVSHPTPLASSTTTKIKLGNPGRRPSREPSTSSFPVSPLPGAMTISASRTIPHAQRAFLPPPLPPGSQQGWRGSLPGLWHPRPTTNPSLLRCGVSLHPAFTTNRRRPLHPFPPRHPPPPPPLLGRQGRREDGISWWKTRWAGRVARLAEPEPRE